VKALLLFVKTIDVFIDPLLRPLYLLLILGAMVRRKTLLL
jgi:hypothetical protein